MHDDGPVNLDAMVEQYHGKTLPDLLNVHLRTMRKEILPQVLRGTFIEFDPATLPQLNEFTDSYMHNWLKPDIATTDLGKLLSRTISDIKFMCTQTGLSLNDNRQFDLFHIMVLKLTLRAHTDTDIQLLLGINKGAL
jgi:hypothetical protein